MEHTTRPLAIVSQAIVTRVTEPNLVATNEQVKKKEPRNTHPKHRTSSDTDATKNSVVNNLTARRNKRRMDAMTAWQKKITAQAVELSSSPCDPIIFDSSDTKCTRDEAKTTAEEKVAVKIRKQDKQDDRSNGKKVCDGETGISMPGVMDPLLPLLPSCEDDHECEELVFEVDEVVVDMIPDVPDDPRGFCGPIDVYPDL